MGIVKLLALHDYIIPPPRETPKAFEFCDVLRKIFVDEQARGAWRKYIKDSRLKRLPNASDSPSVASARKNLSELFTSETPAPDEVKNVFGYVGLDKCKEFFEGKWLEEYALQKLRDAGLPLGITDYGIGMQATRPGSAAIVLELDLAAMWGYQLFAISCIATTNPDSAQEHFFEIYVRANQVGGDEARFALVCLLDPMRKKHLQEKISATWDVEGRVRVFGANDLAELDERFKDWLLTANPM
jgi:hypothetical protein